MEEWRLTSEEMTELITKGWSVNDAQKAKRLAYIESGRVILNPDALEDLYEALEGIKKLMATDFEDFEDFEKASKAPFLKLEQTLAKAKVKDVNNQ